MERLDLRIYNLFPRLYHGPDRWLEAARHARDMGFNTLYLNPYHMPGNSDSIYAIMDYNSYDPVTFPGLTPEDADQQVHLFLRECREMGLRVLCDLVVNHTAMDSPLVEEHPDWYQYDESGKVQPATAFTLEGDIVIWNDCAKLSYTNAESGLWEFVERMCKRYLEMGFGGFRCDVAAYVPADFWRYLIDRLRQEHPDVLFVGEAFLATPSQIDGLAQAGFQYVFSSAKWWDYTEPWFIEQNAEWKERIGSVAFPENHDTRRLMDEVGGNAMLVRQRLFFTALISSGWMITSGFEYGFRKELNVCHTRATDWEVTETDLTGDIRCAMAMRDKYVVLRSDGDLALLPCRDWRVTLLSKSIPGEQALFVLNRSGDKISLRAEEIVEVFPGLIRDGFSDTIDLEPYDLRMFVTTCSAEKSHAGIVNDSYCLDGPKNMNLRRVPVKPLRPGEVLLKIRSCGLCGSDIQEIRNGLFYWRTPDGGGHELTGVVVSLVSPDQGLQMGDFVCYRHPRKGDGIIQGGGFSRYAVVRADCLVRLEEDIDPLCGALIEPLACVIHAGRMLAQEQDIALVGSGTLTLLMERWLYTMRTQCRLTVYYKHDRIVRHTAHQTGCLPFPPKEESCYDAVFEMSGSMEGLLSMQPTLRSGGRVIVMGIYRGQPSINLSDVMFREMMIQGSFLYNEDDFAEAVRLISNKEIRVDDLVQSVPFDRAREAFDMPSSQRMKIVLDHGPTQE